MEDINGICIIHFGGGLNFANRSCFKEEIYKIMQMWPKEEIKVSQDSKKSPKNNKVVPIEMECEVGYYF